MPDDQIPPGFERNSEEQAGQLLDAARRVLGALPHTIPAAAMVFVLPDGSITAALAGDVGSTRAFNDLMRVGPEVLRQTILRFLEGHGRTIVVSR